MPSERFLFTSNLWVSLYKDTRIAFDHTEHALAAHHFEEKSQRSRREINLQSLTNSENEEAWRTSYRALKNVVIESHMQLEYRVETEQK